MTKMSINFLSVFLCLFTHACTCCCSDLLTWFVLSKNEFMLISSHQITQMLLFCGNPRDLACLEVFLPEWIFLAKSGKSL